MKHSLSILLALAAALTVSLSGCSGSSTSADASFSDSDLILNIGGDSYTCAVGIDTVTNALGEDYEYAEGLSCAYDGLDKTFTYEDATFYTNPLERRGHRQPKSTPRAPTSPPPRASPWGPPRTRWWQPTATARRGRRLHARSTAATARWAPPKARRSALRCRATRWRPSS